MSSLWWVAGGAVLLAALAMGCLQRGSEGTGEVVEVNVTVARYQYTPGSEAPLSVPLGSTVVLHLTSADVTHGFAIEGYGVSAEVPAGGTVNVRFQASRAGDFVIYCTVFCGSGHPQHKGTLHVA